MKTSTLFAGGGLSLAALAAQAQAIPATDHVAAVASDLAALAPALAPVDTTPPIWWVAPIASVLALLFAIYFYRKMMGANEGTVKMREIAGYVREGAMAYLYRQYKVVGIVFVVLVVILGVLAKFDIQNPFVPIAFLSGGFFSALCGYLGMKTATNASSRTAQGASESLNRGLQVAFRSGAVMGLVVVGFGLLDICLWYLILDKLVYTAANMSAGLHFLGMELVKPGCSEIDKLVHITTTMITFGMGASTQALFARVGGGIYTKAADVGADLVGKVEAGIPEDDPRNPATIADNVGDNVGDVAGMGADLYESYCGSILATAALGAAVGYGEFTKATTPAEMSAAMTHAVNLVTAPMIVAGIGIVLSILGIFAVRTKEGASQKNLLRALLVGTASSSVLIIAAVFGLAAVGIITFGICGSVVAGLLAGVIIGQSTEYYTSDEYSPTKGIANQAKMGPATAIIDGLAAGMYSTGIPVVTIVLGILFAFGFAGGFVNPGMGLYGVGFAAVGMLATLGITLATDAYGPIADNAGGNAEMAGLPPQVRERTDALDALGNTTAATGKGFAIGSAALTALALLAAYLEEVKIWIYKLSKMAADGTFMGFTPERAKNAFVHDFIQAYDLHIMNPLLLCGMLVGAMMSFVFCAMTMKAVGRAAGAMVEEVRRQFREKPGIMEGKDRPDYAKCVEISTAGAQREMLVPSLLAIIVPVVTGLILGVPGVMGLLTGGLVSGFVLANMLNNAGGAWDNAKKYIEKGNLGGKRLPDGSKNPVHGAAVIGDTVGDPCKDTSGPSLNILIKLMTMVSVVFCPVVIKFSPMIQQWLGLASK
jgi:K(+)-stimulated pyrophosphate-energized sodium pump